jgi:hypothetical protein
MSASSYTEKTGNGEAGMTADRPPPVSGLRSAPPGLGQVVCQPVCPGLVVPSAYGPVLTNRYDTNQDGALVRTGRAFHHVQIAALCAFLETAPEGTVALDVGANFSLFALAFAGCWGIPRSATNPHKHPT